MQCFSLGISVWLAIDRPKNVLKPESWAYVAPSSFIGGFRWINHNVTMVCTSVKLKLPYHAGLVTKPAHEQKRSPSLTIAYWNTTSCLKKNDSFLTESKVQGRILARAEDPLQHQCDPCNRDRGSDLAVSKDAQTRGGSTIAKSDPKDEKQGSWATSSMLNQKWVS